jgi:hypothetical protein
MLLNSRRILFACFLISSLCFGDETVLTVDGRSILLKDDGTFLLLEEADSDKQILPKTNLALVDSNYFTRHTTEYSQKSIRFMPHFKNTSGKTITAIKFDTQFVDPFGDEIYTLKGGSSEERIKPGKISGNRLFYKWEDNQFIDGEPYDKLLTSVTNKTGEIRTQIKIIVFEDGELVKL